MVRDAFTGQPRLAIRSHQIYATNPNGIVAGSQDWSAYAGSLQRGWIGLRPFSDVLVPTGGAVLDAIALQAEILAARYRSGDGTGVALVTPSTSCVQDSGQALWIAIRQLRQEGAALQMSEGDRERFQELGLAFDHLLQPFGRVRGDWANNAALALPLGRRSGFLSRRWHWRPWPQLWPRAARLWVVPALAEEVIFRGLLLPSALDGLRPLGLFVAWHGLRGDPRFLVQVSLLGLACALACVVSGSLWPPVFHHWLAVVAWRQGLRL